MTPTISSISICTATKSSTALLANYCLIILLRIHDTLPANMQIIELTLSANVPAANQAGRAGESPFERFSPMGVALRNEHTEDRFYLYRRWQKLINYSV